MIIMTTFDRLERMTKEGRLCAKAEMMMMGITQMVEDCEEAHKITAYIVRTILDLNNEKAKDKAQEVMNNCFKYLSDEADVRGMVVNTIMGSMVCITYIIDDGEEGVPNDLATPYGVFSHVENLTCPDCSELGYTFFEKKSDGYHRVG